MTVENLSQRDQLFGRRVVFNANGTAYEGLRVAFKVVKYLQGKPNDAEIQVWNLSPQSRQQLQNANIPVILSAGYKSNFAQIFSGQTRTISHVKEKADWVSKIACGDGENTIRTNRCSLSFKANTPLTTIIQQVGKATGLDLGNLASKATNFPDGQSQTPHGLAVSGPAYKQLQDMLNTYGYLVSVQDGALSVLSQAKPGQPLDTTATTAVVLSQTTGMVGSPEIAEKGTDEKQVTKVKSLLQPKFAPGGVVQLDAVNLKGFYRIEKVTHNGDLFENRFYSELELKVIQS